MSSLQTLQQRVQGPQAFAFLCSNVNDEHAKARFKRKRWGYS